MEPLDTGKPFVIFGKKIPAPTPLSDLWNGQVHMHTGFWMAWVTPMVAYFAISPAAPVILDYIVFLYLLVAAIGVWRSTRNPPGSLWPPMVYRIFIILFGISVLLVIGAMAYYSVFYYQDAPNP